MPLFEHGRMAIKGNTISLYHRSEEDFISYDSKEFNFDDLKTYHFKVIVSNTTKVYLNDELVSTNAGTISEFIVPTVNKSILDKIKIEGLINNSVISTKEVNYYAPIDYLCDGKEDVNDLVKFSEEILKLETEGLTEQTQSICS